MALKKERKNKGIKTTNKKMNEWTDIQTNK